MSAGQPDLIRENLAEAAAGLLSVANRTPLIDLPGFPRPVRLKAENQQPMGAFKIRGAWTALRRLPEDVRTRGVVTSSSGNHGLGLAFAAARLGVRAVVVMPENAPQLKQDGIAKLGGEVRLVGALRGPEQNVAATAMAREEGFTLIPAFDHPDVIAGQATIALEILEDWPEVETILCPVGGGGLLAGVCLATSLIERPIRLVGVEPENIPKLSSALRADAPLFLPPGTSLADGLLTRSVGELTWPIIRARDVEAIAVSDAEIQGAMRRLDQLGIRAEPSGAVTTAALMSDRFEWTGPTAVICSGGNVDPLRYSSLVA